MEIRDRLSMKAQLGAYIFSLFFVFAGVLSAREDLFGSSRSDVTASAEEASDAEAHVSEEIHAVSAELIESILSHPSKAKPLPPEFIDEETLWLARAVYSETKRPEEQELVAWVVRNRVETTYRSKRTYRDVVLDPYQFSAFNPESRKRQYYSSLKPTSMAPGWQRALAVAYAVRHADSTYRPFSKLTRHFFSERSMIDQRHPEWAEGLHPVSPRRPYSLDERRFRFYEGVR